MEETISLRYAEELFEYFSFNYKVKHIDEHSFEILPDNGKPTILFVDKFRAKDIETLKKEAVSKVIVKICFHKTDCGFAIGKQFIYINPKIDGYNYGEEDVSECIKDDKVIKPAFDPDENEDYWFGSVELLQYPHDKCFIWLTNSATCCSWFCWICDHQNGDKCIHKGNPKGLTITIVYKQFIEALVDNNNDYLHMLWYNRERFLSGLDINLVPKLRKSEFLKSFISLCDSKSNKRSIEIYGNTVIINTAVFEKIICAFYPGYHDFHTWDYKISEVWLKLLRIKVSNIWERKRCKNQYTMKLEDLNRFKQFMEPTPEPKQIERQSMSNSSPTNILIPSNETKDYRSGCYLIQRSSDSILKRVKIGKGKDVLKRINSEMAYKNCVVISINHVDLNKLSDCEGEIIRVFTETFKLVKDSNEGITGSETFEIDDVRKAKKLFDEICEKYFI